MNNDFYDWHIVESASGYHPKYGYPIAQYLCRSKKDAEEIAKEIHDPVIKKYSDLTEDKKND